MITRNIPFKTFAQNQALLLPPDIDELIEKDHPVRVINEVLNNLDIDSICKQYKGGGTSSYHPRILLKVLVNYQLLEDKEVEAYVKYNYFDKKQQGSRSSFNADQLHYNEEEDFMVCSMGQHMNNIGSHIEKNRNGYAQMITRYQAPNCNGCPLRGVCHKQKGNRIIEVNHNLRKLKNKAAERLRSDEGIRRRKNRCV